MDEHEDASRKKLLEVLRTRNPELIKDFVSNHRQIRGIRLPKDDSMWELAMHLMLSEAQELPGYQDESREWLALVEQGKMIGTRQPTALSRAIAEYDKGRHQDSKQRSKGKTREWWPSYLSKNTRNSRHS